VERLFAYLSWQRVPTDQIHFKALTQETNVLLLYAILYIVSGYLLGLVIQIIPLPILQATQFNQDVWYSLVFKITLLLIVPGFIYFYRWNYRPADLLLGLKPTVKIAITLAIMPTVGFFLNATHLKELTLAIPNFEDAWLRLIFGILMPLFTAAIPEEFFFRGYLQTRLEKKWNRLSAIMLSTLLFTAWHLPSRYLLSNGVEGQAGDWIQVLLHTGIPVFIIGAIFALHWSRYRNIILLIITHWAIDILPSLSSYFKISF
jgi:uncharacterized protein